MAKKKEIKQENTVIIKQLASEFIFKDFSYVWRHKSCASFAIMHITGISEDVVSFEAEEFVFNMPKPKYCIRHKKLLKTKTSKEFCDSFNRQLGKEPEKSAYEVWSFNNYEEAEKFILVNIANRYEVPDDNFITM